MDPGLGDELSTTGNSQKLLDFVTRFDNETEIIEMQWKKMNGLDIETR